MRCAAYWPRFFRSSWLSPPRRAPAPTRRTRTRPRRWRAQAASSLTTAPLTSEFTLVPAHAILESSLDRNPSSPEAMDAMLAEGFGDLKEGPAWAMTPSTLDDAPPPAPGKAPKRLTRFVHLADTQLADDESPARLASYDSPGSPARSARRRATSAASSTPRCGPSTWSTQRRPSTSWCSGATTPITPRRTSSAGSSRSSTARRAWSATRATTMIR